MKRSNWLLLASLALALPAMAQAQDAYVTGNVNMRAGPDVSYPLVAQIPAGTEVDVQGCTSGWEWCDVIAYNSRGWVAGNFIQDDYDDQDVLLPDYGAQIGIPIIAFSIGTYWDRYYRNRPFYREREHWYHRPVVHHAPPRPIHHPYVRHRDGRGNPGDRNLNNHPGPVAPGHALHRAPPPHQDHHDNSRPTGHPVGHPPTRRPVGRPATRPADHVSPPPQEQRSKPHGYPVARPAHLAPVHRPTTLPPRAVPNQPHAASHGHAAPQHDKGHHGSDGHDSKDDHHH